MVLRKNIGKRIQMFIVHGTIKKMLVLITRIIFFDEYRIVSYILDLNINEGEINKFIIGYKCHDESNKVLSSQNNISFILISIVVTQNNF